MLQHTTRMAAPPSFGHVFRELKRNGTISPSLARRVFDTVLAGGWTPLQTGVFLGSLQLVGEDVSVAVTAAQAMRDLMVPLEHERPMLFDASSAGVESRVSLSISTGVALILAAAGVPVALQGDERLLQKRAAETMQALGLPVDMTPSAASKVLEVAGIAYLPGSHHHPGLKFLTASRRELGTPTLVDLLLPLANPGRPTHHLVGASSDETRVLLAEALAELGSKRAWVVHSEDGLDMLSPHGPTRVSVLSLRRVKEGTVKPEDFGLEPSPPGAIDGGSPSTNAGIIAEVLCGKNHPARNGFLINAAAALAISRDMRLEDAADLVAQLLDSGKALAALERWGAACRAQLPKR